MICDAIGQHGGGIALVCFSYRVKGYGLKVYVHYYSRVNSQNLENGHYACRGPSKLNQIMFCANDM